MFQIELSSLRQGFYFVRTVTKEKLVGSFYYTFFRFYPVHIIVVVLAVYMNVYIWLLRTMADIRRQCFYICTYVCMYVCKYVYSRIRMYIDYSLLFSLLVLLLLVLFYVLLLSFPHLIEEFYFVYFFYYYYYCCCCCCWCLICTSISILLLIILLFFVIFRFSATLRVYTSFYIFFFFCTCIRSLSV